jgi:hypothetical protein
VQRDIPCAGEAAAGMNPVYQQRLETEDDVEAAEDIQGAPLTSPIYLAAYNAPF